MIFKDKVNIHRYASRLDMFSGLKDYDEILFRYLNLEPHTLLNMGHAINLFCETNIGKNVLSIGIDPLKEWSLIRSGIDNITVYDIDRACVDIGN